MVGNYLLGNCRVGNCRVGIRRVGNCRVGNYRFENLEWETVEWETVELETVGTSYFIKKSRIQMVWTDIKSNEFTPYTLRMKGFEISTKNRSPTIISYTH